MHGLCPQGCFCSGRERALDGREQAGRTSDPPPSPRAAAESGGHPGLSSPGAPEAAEASGLKATHGHRSGQRVTPGGMAAPGFLQGEGTLSSCPPFPPPPLISCPVLFLIGRDHQGRERVPAAPPSQARADPPPRLQMAKVAPRVSALEGQQFLVIHATADGERLTLGAAGNVALRAATGSDRPCPLSFNRKNPFPAHGRAHHTAH